MSQAKSGDTVHVHYTGKLGDGSVFDSSEGRDPLSFELGKGMVVPGFEKAVTGMEVGEQKTVTFPSEEAYGPHDPAKIQKVGRSRVPEEIDLQLGMQLGARTENGQQITFTVVDIADDEITIDANHPLAGKDLTFQVELVEIV